MTPEELEAIEARANKATEGPWAAHMDDFTVRVDASYIPAQRKIALCATGDNANCNTTFIAAARQDIPDLIAEVRRLREELTQHKALMLEAVNEFDKIKVAVNARFRP